MNRAPKFLLIGGLGLLVFAPLAGLFSTVFGMVFAFHSLGAQGISDPSTLSHSIGWSLGATMCGLLLGFVGLLLACGAGLWHFLSQKNAVPAPNP